LSRTVPAYVTISVPVDDESLIADIASGDAVALAALLRRFQARVYGLALSVVGDSGLAEEVAQDAFMRAWRYAGKYDPRRGRVATWLLTITRNLAVDAIRLRRDHPVDPERMVALMTQVSQPPVTQVGQSPAEDTEQFKAVLLALPPDQARPVVLSVFYGFTAKEIANQEGIPLGTAKTRIRRGLARLRRVWGANDG
jgi:RNA polymerase sigma factor (sigma-70 family)